MNVIRSRQLALDRLQLDLHLLAQLEVERAERLVEQQHARAVDERARERDALALAAGQLDRPALADVGEPHHRQRVGGAPAALALAHALDAQPVGDVLGDAHVREQRVVLKDGVERALVRRAVGHVDAVQLDRARVGELEAGDHSQRRRLARARRSEHREELARAAHRASAARRRRRRRRSCGCPSGARPAQGRARWPAVGQSSARRSLCLDRPSPASLFLASDADNCSVGQFGVRALDGSAIDTRPARAV